MVSVMLSILLKKKNNAYAIHSLRTGWNDIEHY
jgi:hypothetical protein